MSGRSYRVFVAQTPEQWTAWHDAVKVEPDENPHFARVRHIETTGETAVQLDGPTFYWVCPSCGRILGGTFGDEPVSGWENPRWVNSGTRERPTFTPSLGCSGWPRGECTGHWFLRDGELVPA